LRATVDRLKQQSMSAFVDPATGLPLREEDGALVSAGGSCFPVVGKIPRFCATEDYTSSFGLQWNLFDKTQIDCEGAEVSARRLFAETCWRPGELEGFDILEVGSGAGRFSRAILEHTRANLYSIDYSTAVEANLRNNGGLGEGRFFLAQASIYELPFPDGRFDKVLCLGVLQHTPDFEKSVAALIAKAKPGAEIVVDFYEIRGWWTKLNAKYLLRPFTKRMAPEELLRTIDQNTDRLIAASNLLGRFGLGVLRRFLPIVDFENAVPPALPPDRFREWVVLDTFDMFSPAYDNPQKISAVERMFERHGASVTFAGNIDNGSGKAAVVRAIRR